METFSEDVFEFREASIVLHSSLLFNFFIISPFQVFLLHNVFIFFVLNGYHFFYVSHVMLRERNMKNKMSKFTLLG